ncbi:MAG: sigma 54-interacting transcriptional regulator [Desulfobacterales bacterium]|nr:sigma 54-interacting transcriptional regulator [Desulfobacterales bacterium]
MQKKSFGSIEKNNRPHDIKYGEAFYEDLIDSLFEGVSIIQDGIIIFANQSFLNLFGYKSVNEVVNKHIKELISSEDIESLDKFFSQLLIDKTSPYIFKGRFINNKGKKIWAEIHGNFFLYDNKPAGLISLQDITTTMQKENEVKQEHEELLHENINLRTSIKERFKFRNIIGKSSAMQEVYEQIMMASMNDANVLIVGESGTGKDLVAKAIHDMSARANKDFVPINSGAIPETLIESEFFGHVKGAFTGAIIDKHGLFYSANNGTLFLDEVGEICLNMQVKLLRAIETGEYMSIGDTKTKKANVRIIAATNRNLRELVKKGAMREDFYYRLVVIPITLPPLRDRKEDIPLLVDHFLSIYDKGKKHIMSPKIMDSLLHYNWPGNVRELHSVIQRYIAVGKVELFEQVEDKQDLQHQDQNNEIKDLKTAINDFEKQYITKILEINRWHKGKTASVLEIDAKTLYIKSKKLGII